ncbi:MAG TPA: DUF2330 domain-containing protein [Labilithrix sp.]|nr:DUF2330 domain-containing protein [Labilithrix sp.]
MKLRLAAGIAVAILFALTPRVAAAFCGFYVSGADAKLFADATQVVMMREGTRTVLAMQNDYQGPPKDFAMVIPVPVILQKENVKTLPKELFAKVDALSAPRLVEYWEQDPCRGPDQGGLKLLGGAGFGSGGGAGLAGIGGGTSTVRIEAQFEVGEYEILILSAQDSGGLDAWLRGRGYKIPDNAEPALRPYVQAGSKFFVAKVNVAKVTFEGGRAQLSPLRFHYDSETFTLPVRLGMLNSSGTQDLIVQILAPRAQRYAVANYPAATIPTNLDVAESARGSFPAFYAALLDKTLEKTPGAVVTEYAWGASSCDPCPGSVQGLTTDDLATLGADVLPSAKVGPLEEERSVRVPVGVVTVGAPSATGGRDVAEVARVVAGFRARLRQCYQTGLNSDPTMAGSLTTTVVTDASGTVTRADVVANKGLSPAVAACVSARLRQATFSPAAGEISLSIAFAIQRDDGPPPPAAPRSIGLRSIASDFVLTRLHARYARGALAADLVFAAAGKITGGRESRDAKGQLETGAVAAETNAFQGRYVIRHGWTGPIACEKPVRGSWGGPWPDAGSGDRAPAVATKLAYAPRGGATLASFVPNGVPELALVGAVPPAPGPESVAPREADAAADAGGASAPAPRAARCGCDVIGSGSGGFAAAAGLALLASAIGLRRRARA